MFELRVPTGDETEGEVIEVGGRLGTKGGVDAGWAKVKLDDDREVVVLETGLVDVMGDG